MRNEQVNRMEDVPSRAVIAFFILTFLITWGLISMYIVSPERAAAWFGEMSGTHPFFFIATWGPALAAFAIVLWYGGLGGMKAFLSRLSRWRSPLHWGLLIIVGLPVIFMIGSAFKGGPLLAPVPEDGVSTLFVIAIVMLFLGPVEEFGWRGVAQPLLQRYMAPIWAGALIGLAWGVWHLPAFFLSGVVYTDWNFVPFLIGNIALAVLITPIFNETRGGLLWPIIFHWQLILPFWPDAQPFDTWMIVVLAVAIVWFKRDTMFTRQGAETTVIPHRDARKTRVSKTAHAH